MSGPSRKARSTFRSLTGPPSANLFHPKIRVQGTKCIPPAARDASTPRGRIFQRRSSVLQATCPGLRAFATLLREKYDLRFALIARNATDDELRDVEAEVFRVNRLMTSHRRRCPACTPTCPSI